MVHGPIGHNLLVYQRKVKFITQIVSHVQILVKAENGKRMDMFHDRLIELLGHFPEQLNDGRVTLIIHDDKYYKFDIESFSRDLKEKRSKMIFHHMILIGSEWT